MTTGDKTKSNKIRLQFDVSREELDLMDKMRRGPEAFTRTAFIKRAIKLYTLILQEQHEGYELVLVKGDKKTFIRFL